MNYKNRLAKLETQQQQRTAVTPEEIKRRALRWAELFDSDPGYAAAVKANAAKDPNPDNLRLLRIVELLETAAARRAIA